MKYLLVLLVVVIVLWLMLRGRDKPVDRSPRGKPGPPQMVACAHCGLHLPQPAASADAEGRPYCSDAHHLARPR